MPSSAEFAERFLERSNIGTKLNKSFFRLERVIGGSLRSCLTFRSLLNESSFCVNRTEKGDLHSGDVDQTQSAVDIALLLSSLSRHKES